MKKLAFIFFIVAATHAGAQNILRVNNTNGVNAPYPTIASAVSAAGPNDIIIVEGSLVPYGDITINKKVNIGGPGYFLTENTGLQANLQPATISSITVNSGANGSSFSGLTIPGNPYIGVTFALNGVSNIRVSNSYIAGSGILINGTSSNIIIDRNYITVQINSGNCNCTQIIIANNILGSYGIYSGNSSLLTVTNNIIGGSSGTCKIWNSDVLNNIFIGSGLPDLTASVLKYNVFVAPPPSNPDPSNFYNATQAALFIGPAGNTTDSQWKLKSGSPAIGFGENGVDCGMFGGATPYNLSGIPVGQPTITGFSTPGTVQQNGTLNVKVSAKVN